MVSEGVRRVRRGRVVGAAVAIAAALGLARAGALCPDGGAAAVSAAQAAPASGFASGAAVYTVKVPGVG